MALLRHRLASVGEQVIAVVSQSGPVNPVGQMQRVPLPLASSRHDPPFKQENSGRRQRAPESIWHRSPSNRNGHWQSNPPSGVVDSSHFPLLRQGWDQQGSVAPFPPVDSNELCH